MTLYSDPVDAFCHRVRMVLAEKGVTVEIAEIDSGSKPEELAELNPYNEVPVLADRDLVLYESRVIMEYLDERFPHPPLMPVYPVARAQCRLMVYRMDRDWYSLLDELESAGEGSGRRARADLRDSLTSLAPIFEDRAFIMGDEFSLVDCSLAPVLWRLPGLGIELPPRARPLKDYAERIFSRESFMLSLSKQEREMRH